MDEGKHISRKLQAALEEQLSYNKRLAALQKELDKVTEQSKLNNQKVEWLEHKQQELEALKDKRPKHGWGESVTLKLAENNEATKRLIEQNEKLKERIMAEQMSRLTSIVEELNDVVDRLEKLGFHIAIKKSNGIERAAE